MILNNQPKIIIYIYIYIYIYTYKKIYVGMTFRFQKGRIFIEELFAMQIWAATWYDILLDICAQQRLRPAWTFMQAHQSLYRALIG